MKPIEWTSPSSAEALLRQGQEEGVVVLRDGRAVAVVMPIDPEDAEWFARESDPAFIDSIARARADVAAGRTMSHDELKRELGLSD